MYDLSMLEATYREFTDSLAQRLPDGIMEVDLAVLQSLGLMRVSENPEYMTAPLMTRHFHVLESSDKISLFNQHYVAWIVPKIVDGHAQTLVLVATNSDAGPELELAFKTTGAFNYSDLVLQLLEQFLVQIRDTENELKNLLEAS